MKRYRRFFPELHGTEDTLHIMGCASKKSLDSVFNVLVWNIYKAKIRGWEEDFVTFLNEHDLILLQESISNTRYDSLFHNDGKFEWVMARAHKSQKSLASTGIKTGSMVKSSMQNFFKSPYVEPIFKTPKMLLATAYPFENSDSQLLVVNIHAVNFVSFEKFSSQINQIIEAIGQHAGPVILAGDFNTWNGMRYKNLREVAEKLGLIEADLVRKRKILHLNQHLDHIFYRGLRLQEATVLSKIQSSDHHPISAKFSLS